MINGIKKKLRKQVFYSEWAKQAGWVSHSVLCDNENN